MLKRCLSPLTLVNQVALIVLLSTAIGLAGMAGFWLAGARRSGQRPCDQQSGIAAHAKLPSVGGSAIKRERQALN
ncbi:nitrate/nitrite two-component sensor kinase [Escherichia coli]|nr:nitrate/nitrite two-component sensor kinase [Escherichia coli]